MAGPPELEGAAGMEVEEPLSRGFSEEQFGAACRELDQPAPAAVGPWQLLVETTDVRIYRLYHEQTGLYEYKIFGGLADVPPKLCVDVYMDLDFRKEWDQYVKGASSTASAGEEKLFLWVTADLQGMPTEAWFGIYYIGKESPIWGTVLVLSMSLAVYFGLTFKNLALGDIEHLRHESAVREEKSTVTVKVNHLSGSHSSSPQSLSQQSSPWLSPMARQVHGPLGGSCCLREGSCAVELYEKTYDGEKVIYWEVKYPFPLSNRDYVYVRECREMDVHGRKIWVVLAKSVAVPQCPEKPGIIRVKSYKQSLVIESDGKAGCKVYMYYFDNPGGMIPTWLVNWAAKSGVPAFLKDIKKACLNYSKSTN